jgi:hypothetical protein
MVMEGEDDEEDEERTNKKKKGKKPPGNFALPLHLHPPFKFTTQQFTHKRTTRNV